MNIYDDLIRDEGLKLKPYEDTVGKLTIGVGRNLDDVGITKEEALALMRNDVKQCIRELERSLPFFRFENQVRKDALVNMCFNLGLTRLLRFKKMIAAFENRDYEEAAKQALDSKWARQVGARSARIARLIKTGER